MKANKFRIIAIAYLTIFSLSCSACEKKDNDVTPNIAPPIISGYFDGPYIIYQSSDARIISISPSENGALITDNIIPTTELRSKKNKVYPDGKENNERLKPFEIELFDFYDETQWDFKQPEKVFAISDMECSFSNTQAILKAGHVIDENYNWIYGTNHLVINGDMFSRGFDMMALLWLLYKLDYEAHQAGGKVHVIIGNHESMNLKGDVRYVEQRYLNFCTELRISYQDLFNEDTELGRWLRTKNTIVRIGRNLIVHGGISKEYLTRSLSPIEVNNIVRRDLGKQTAELDETAKFIFGTYGPHWFRGMINIGDNRLPVFADDMPPILSYFNVDRVIVGHCKYENVLKYRNRLVVGIDVNHSQNRSQGEARALLIELSDGNEVLTRVNDKSQMESIPDGNPND